MIGTNLKFRANYLATICTILDRMIGIGITFYIQFLLMYITEFQMFVQNLIWWYGNQTKILYLVRLLRFEFNLLTKLNIYFPFDKR